LKACNVAIRGPADVVSGVQAEIGKTYPVSRQGEDLLLVGLKNSTTAALVRKQVEEGWPVESVQILS